MPSRKSEGALVAGTGTTIAVPLPATVAGDYGIMYVFVGASTTPPTISGWTQTGASFPNGGGGAAHMYYRTFSSTAAATTVNVTVTAGGAMGKISLWTGAGTGAPTISWLGQGTAVAYIQSPALTTALAGAVHFGFINDVRTVGTVSNQGTITATNTARAFESVLSAYQFTTITSDITSSAGGAVRQTFTGGNTTSFTGTAILPNPTYTGTAASTLPALTQSAAGEFDAPVYTGTGGSTLPGLTQSATGEYDPPAAPTYTGQGASTLPGLTQSASGEFDKPVYVGTASSILPSLTQSASGEFDEPTYTGTAASALPPLTQSAQGVYAPPGAYVGTAASLLPGLTQQAQGTYTPGGPPGDFTYPLTLTGQYDPLELTGTAPTLTLTGRAPVLTLKGTT